MQKEIILSTKELVNVILDLTKDISSPEELREKIGGSNRWCERVMDLKEELVLINKDSYTLTEGKISTYIK